MYINRPDFVEVIMRSARLLFPFVHGMNIEALEQAVLLAKDCKATLVPASLIRLTQKQQASGPRLEHVEQSQDFLEAISYRAQKNGIPVEPVEVATSDVPQCIDTLIRTLDCDGVLLFMHGKDAILLDINDIRCVMQTAPGRFYLFHLESKNHVSLNIC
jgi:nucleotide-binding universal stress UspA family protein